MHCRGSFLIGAVFASGIASTACSDMEGPTPPRALRTRVQPEWVTASAAAALDSASGLFRLTYPSPQWISQIDADSLAAAVARVIGSPDPLNIGRQAAEADRGGAIDFGSLKVCERDLYVLSPFGTFPPQLPGYARRAWGPHWSVSFCGRDGTVQLSLGIPDNPTDLQIVNGVLVRARTEGGGDDSNGAGVPMRFLFGLPVAPEDAVKVIYERAARRVATPPVPFNQLDDRGFGQLALCASWRLSTDSDVAVRSETTGALMAAREFFVRRFPACYSDSLVVYVADNNQPQTWPLLVFSDTVTNDPSAGMDTIRVPVLGPVAFQRVAFIR